MPERCGLLDRWGLYVQGVLGLLAFSSLILKRWRETPRRPLKIWFFDTSKQAFSSLIVHFITVFSSDWLSHSSTEDNDPCTWYFMSIVVDATFGLGMLVLLLKLSSLLVHKLRLKTLYSGEYGDPPKAKVWLAQCIFFLFVTLINKLLAVVIMFIPFWQTLGGKILHGIRSISPQLEAVVAMLLAPFLITTCIFWVTDTFLKGVLETTPRRDRSNSNGIALHDLSIQHTSETTLARQRLLANDSDDSDGQV
eukprot:m.262610 g.262610  ORF g.262610 m.262610 type:complete len:251 (+) comp15595_c0_seq4:151-903(+)